MSSARNWEIMQSRTSRRKVLSGAAALAGGAALSAPTFLKHASAQATEVTFWTSFTGGTEVDTLNAIVDAFNTSQADFKVSLVQVPGNSESDVTKLMTAVRGGVGPDVYLFNRPFAMQRAADGVLQDLTPYLNGEDLSGEYLEFAYKECLYKDGLYALPFDTDARALYYRKDIMTEVGVDPAELDAANGPITLDRLTEITNLIDQKDGSGKYTRLGFVPWFSQGWHYTWGYDFGGSFYSPEECKITATNEGVVAGFNYMYERAQALGPSEVQEFLSAVNRPDAPPAQNPFMTGAIAFMVSGDWDIANLANYAPDIDYGITYIPVPKEGDSPSSWSAGFSAVMPQGAKNPEGATAFIRYFTGPDGQRAYVKATSHLPTYATLLEEADLYTEQHIFFKDLLQHSTSLPTVAVGAQLWDELTSAQEKVTLAESTPEDALKAVDDRVNQQLQRYC
jgi:multiple sugar transport system substrate-binding protein